MSTLNSSSGYTTSYTQAGAFWGMTYAFVSYSYDSSGVLVDETFYNAAHQVVATESFQSDGSFIVTLGASGSFWGANYASAAYGFTSSGVLDKKTFYNAADQMVAMESFQSDGSFIVTLSAGGSFWGANYVSVGYGFTSSGVLDSTTYYNAANQAVAMDSIQSNGAFSVTLNTGGSYWGVNYASAVYGFTSSGVLSSKAFYNAANQTVATDNIRSDGSFSVTLSAGGSFWGVNYTSATYDFTSSNVLDNETFYNGAGQIVVTKTILSSGASNVMINVGGVLSGVSYTSIDYAIDANGVLNLMTYYENSALAGVDTFNANRSYDARVYTGGSFDGVTYASLDSAYTASGLLDRKTFYDASGAMVASQTFDSNGGYTVIIDGLLDLSAAGSSVTISGAGLTLTGANGTGAGAAQLGTTGATSNCILIFQDNQTLDNAVVTLSGINDHIAASTSQAYYSGVGNFTAATLTFGPNLVINQIDGTDDTLTSAGGYGGNIVNLGTINAEAHFGSLGINATGFDNKGTIVASAGDTLTINPGSAWSNEGSISAIGGTSMYLDGTFANTGTISIQGYNVAYLGDVSGANGQLDILQDGTLDARGAVSSGQTLNFGGGYATLEINDAATFSAPIAGMAATDAIALLSPFGAASFGFTEDASGVFGVLTVSDGTKSANLKLLGQYAASDFAMAANASGGVTITHV